MVEEVKDRIWAENLSNIIFLLKIMWSDVRLHIYIYIYTLASPWYLLKLTNTDTLMYGPTFIDVDQR